MPGIVSLLDSETSRRIVELRRRLEDELGVRTPVENHCPHVSYQVAERYDQGLVDALRELAAEQDPFSVRTNGIGVFTDSEPLVVYVPVVRDAGLSALHERVWDRCSPLGSGLQDYYRPDRWTPHITIAPVDRDELPSVVDLLGEHSCYWEANIETIATIQGTAPNRTVEHRTSLGQPES